MHDSHDSHADDGRAGENPALPPLFYYSLVPNCRVRFVVSEVRRSALLADMTTVPLSFEIQGGGTESNWKYQKIDAER